MKKPVGVKAANLRKRINARELEFKTTEDLPLMKNGVMGQERAIRSITFGMRMKGSGYNIYVAGPPNTGSSYLARTFIEKEAQKDETPPDWCYVYDFADPDQPKALRLFPGQARVFKKDMDELISSVRRAISGVFESDGYRKRRERVIMAYGKKRRARIDELNKIVKEKGFLLNIDEVEMMVVPAEDGKPLNEEQLMAMSEQERDRLRAVSDCLQIELNNANRDFLKFERGLNEELKNLDKEVALHAVEGRFSDLCEKYKNQPGIIAYVGDEVKADCLKNIEDFKKKPHRVPVDSPDGEVPVELVQEASSVRYDVNILIDNAGRCGAPVVYETNPTYTNLFGKIEKKARYGMLFTDFTMIRAGALHRANGGYLILKAPDLLKWELAWEALKRAIRTKEIKIEDFGEVVGLVTTTTVRPLPIPLNIKVILVGGPYLYQLLYFYDDNFAKMFKAKAHLDTVIDNTSENMTEYVRCIGDICRRENLRHFDGTGVAKLLEYAMELAGDKEKLTLRLGNLTGIMKEADYWALQTNARFVRGKDVEQAITEKDQRSNLYEERTQELIARGVLRVETDGMRVGEINGLTIINIGDYTFGKPARITANVSHGKDGIVTIDRESDMSGEIHTKGVMILTGYLRECFAQKRPLTLSASLCFEQSYDIIDGDSASAAELFVLLSSIAGVPISQGIAVTGAVSQKGEILPIGGVNEKIKGFFDVCKEKGFTGKQGVIIPKPNVRNLMLANEIVRTVKKKQFHVWAIETVEQGIEIMSGLKAGRRRKDYTYTPGSFLAKVAERLGKLAGKKKA